MAKKTERYVIQCPSPEFMGTRYDVKFEPQEDGSVAVVNSKELRDKLVKDLGYKDITPTED